MKTLPILAAALFSTSIPALAGVVCEESADQLVVSRDDRRIRTAEAVPGAQILVDATGIPSAYPDALSLWLSDLVVALRFFPE